MHNISINTKAEIEMMNCSNTSLTRANLFGLSPFYISETVSGTHISYFVAVLIFPFNDWEIVEGMPALLAEGIHCYLTCKKISPCRFLIISPLNAAFELLKLFLYGEMFTVFCDTKTCRNVKIVVYKNFFLKWTSWTLELNFWKWVPPNC